MAMARDSPCSARRRPRRRGVCQGWLRHVSRVGGVRRHDVRRRKGRGRVPPPAWRRGLRSRHDSMNPVVARMPHFQRGFRRIPVQREEQGQAALRQVGRLGTVRLAKGGLDSPRRIDQDADDRWQTSSAAEMKHGRSVEFLFFHAIAFSLNHDRLPVTVAFGLSLKNRRSTPWLAMLRWSSSGPRRTCPEKIRRSTTREFFPRKGDGSR